MKDKSKVKKYESDSEEDYEELGEVDPSGQVFLNLNKFIIIIYIYFLFSFYYV